MKIKNHIMSLLLIISVAISLVSCQATNKYQMQFRNIFLIAVVFVVVLVILYLFTKNNFQKKMKAANNILDSLEEELHKKYDDITQLKNKLKVTEERLKQAEDNNITLFKYAFLNDVEKVEEKDDILFDDFLNGNKTIDENDWKIFMTEIDKKYPDFKIKLLKSMTKINEPLLHVAYL